MALFVFGVPLKGSLPTLALGALLYVAATTGYGMLISSPLPAPRLQPCSARLF